MRRNTPILYRNVALRGIANLISTVLGLSIAEYFGTVGGANEAANRRVDLLGRKIWRSNVAIA